MSVHPKSGLVFTCLAVAGCERAPSFDILGSYFPGWLVCLTVALLITVLVRFLLLRLKIEVAAPIVVYPSLLASLTFALWLLFLQ
jgi:YtcA family